MNYYAEAMQIYQDTIDDYAKSRQILLAIAKRNPSTLVKAAIGDREILINKIKDAYEKGGKLPAVKLHRSFFNTDLKESKQSVEDLVEKKGWIRNES